MENSESILKQLKIIKWLVVFISVCILIAASSIAAFSYLTGKAIAEGYLPMNDEGFSDKVSDLIDEGKTEEAIKMANEHLKSHPNDEYGYWYRGKAYYLQKSWQLAIDDFNKAEEIAPSWKNTHTDPFRTAAQSKLGKAESSASQQK